MVFSDDSKGGCTLGAEGRLCSEAKGQNEQHHQVGAVLPTTNYRLDAGCKATGHEHASTSKERTLKQLVIRRWQRAVVSPLKFGM